MTGRSLQTRSTERQADAGSAARLINADIDEIALTENATVAMGSSDQRRSAQPQGIGDDATEDRAIAAAAMIGESNRPKT